MQVTIREAKTQLSKLIAAAERGEGVIISRRDKSVVRIVAERPESNRRVLGFLASHEVKLDGFWIPCWTHKSRRIFFVSRRRIRCTRIT